MFGNSGDEGLNCIGVQSASQIRLALILSIWLCAAAARQAFDVVGRLWIPVVFNVFQILSCVLGLLAACQRRAVLLAALSASTVISIVYNVLLALWYEDVFGGDLREGSDALAAGAPSSHSFFVRYTPMCDAAAEFNKTTGRWSQDPEKCYVPFYRVESLQAGVHAVIALLTLVLSVMMLAKRRRGVKKTAEKPRRRGRSNGLAICAASPHFLGAGVTPNASVYGSGDSSNEYTSMSSIQRQPPTTASLNKSGGAFLNSSYDSTSPGLQSNPSVHKSQNDHSSNVQPSQNDIYSKYAWMYKRPESDSPNTVRSADIGRKSQLWHSNDDYSAAPTIEIDHCRPPTVAHIISNSTSTAGDESVPDPPSRSPLQPRKLSTFAEINSPTTTAIDESRPYDDAETYSEIGAYGRSALNYELPLSRAALHSTGRTDAMPPIPSGGRLYASRNANIRGLRKSCSAKYAQPTPIISRQSAPYSTDDITPNMYHQQSPSQNELFDSQHGLQSFGKQYSRLAANTPTDFSIQRPHYNDNETHNESDFHERDAFQPNTHTNLISFDPKSNTLIRVRKHQHEPRDFDMPIEDAEQRQSYFSMHHQRTNSYRPESQAEYYRQYSSENMANNQRADFDPTRSATNEFPTLGNQHHKQALVNDFANYFPQMTPNPHDCRRIPLLSGSNSWQNQATDSAAYSVYSNDYCVEVDRAQPSTRFPIGGSIYEQHEAQVTVASVIPLLNADNDMTDTVNRGKLQNDYDFNISSGGIDNMPTPANFDNSNELMNHLNRYVHDERKHVTSFPKENCAQFNNVAISSHLTNNQDSTPPTIDDSMARQSFQPIPLSRQDYI